MGVAAGVATGVVTGVATGVASGASLPSGVVAGEVCGAALPSGAVVLLGLGAALLAALSVAMGAPSGSAAKARPPRLISDAASSSSATAFCSRFPVPRRLDLLFFAGFLRIACSPIFPVFAKTVPAAYAAGEAVLP